MVSNVGDISYCGLHCHCMMSQLQLSIMTADSTLDAAMPQKGLVFLSQIVEPYYSGIRLMNPRLINPAAYYIQFAWNGIVPILSRYKNLG